MIFKIRGCSLGCPDTIADIGKALSQLQGFFFTIVCDSKDNIAEVWQMKIGSLKSLVESFFQVRSLPMTSPVDFISGPKRLSTLASLVKEKTGALI